MTPMYRLVGLALIISSLGLPAALASHEHQEFRVSRRFGNQTAGVLVMDALPSGPNHNDDPRTVWLDFTIELFGDWHGNAPGLEAPFEIVANEELVLRTTFSTFEDVPHSYPGTFPSDNHLTGGPRTYDLHVSFPLNRNTEWGADIHLLFQHLGLAAQGSSWSIRDGSLDWSRPLGDPIPEPGFIVPVVLALVGWGVSQARKSQRAKRARSNREWLTSQF